MKYIYVCSHYGGQEENYKRALVYGKFVVGTGNIPIIPHTMLHGVLDDKITAEREKGLAVGLKLLMECDELWVFGGVVTAGMKNEIAVAEKHGIEVVHQSSVISPNELSADVAIIYSYYEKMYGRCNRAMVDDAFYFLKEPPRNKPACQRTDCRPDRQGYIHLSVKKINCSGHHRDGQHSRYRTGMSLFS